MSRNGVVQRVVKHNDNVNCKHAISHLSAATNANNLCVTRPVVDVVDSGAEVDVAVVPVSTNSKQATNINSHSEKNRIMHCHSGMF